MPPAMSPPPPPPIHHQFLLLHIFFLLLFPLLATSDLATETQSLLNFITAVPHSRQLNWNSSTFTCTWVGITCDSTNSSIFALRLPAIGLAGPIPPSTLSLLSSLRVLSIHSNRLSGPLPDFTNLTLLRSLYLHKNQFTGQLTGAITSLPRLTRLDLSSNKLSGELPFSLNNLTKLTGLFLQNNNFSGSLPAIDIESLNDFNVANNSLNGSIPKVLSRFSESSFAGNLGLCGDPLPPCSPFFPSPSPAPASPSAETRKRKKLSTGAVIGIIVAAVVVALVLLLLLVLLCLRCRRRGSEAGKKEAASAVGAAAATRSAETGMTSSSGGGTGGAGEAAGVPAAAERNRLVFVGSKGGYSFDLEDLLRASAEVLGKGSTGTSYKAVLEDGAMVVVKRLKDVTATKGEFEEHIQKLSKIEEHANLLPIRAYYYSNDEKLLVYDYISGGSLSSLLHGSRGSGRTPLDWDNRMRIALAAARGLSHLHNVANTVHGNIKASNVLLRSDPDDSVLSDYGLHVLFGYSAPPSRLAGYRAPEVIETRRSTFKSDVYSFGVLLLELLTGKAPNHASLGDDGIDLPRWVQSVLTEEWTAEVFDAELLRYQNIEEEMVELLQIAMTCVATVPDSRPDISNVLRMMGEIGHRGDGTEDIQAGPRSPPTATA